LNTVWMLRCRAEGAAFSRASRRVGETQAQLLGQLVRANRDTAFGTAHRFADVSDPRTYQRLLPPGPHHALGGPLPPLPPRGAGVAPAPARGRVDTRGPAGRPGGGGESDPAPGGPAPPVPARGRGVDRGPVPAPAGRAAWPGLLVDLAATGSTAAQPRRHPD